MSGVLHELKEVILSADGVLSLFPTGEEGEEGGGVGMLASPIRPRRFVMGPTRGLKKQAAGDKPLIQLQWMVRVYSCSVDTRRVLNV